MIAPAPLEPDADELRDAWARRIGTDIQKAVPNLRRCAARERREAAIKRRRESPAAPDTMTTLGDALGLRLRRVGEVADPPPVRPVTRRRRRKP